MMLLVDIGNTRIKWAQFESKLSPLGSSIYTKENLPQQLEVNWGCLASPGSVYIANVGSKDLEAIIGAWVKEKWGCETYFIKSSSFAVGVTNGYISPEQLGVDRWLAIIAAHHLFAGDCCVFDCGTAITMDLIDVNGFHQGGLIFPGLSLLQKSLITNTQLGTVEFSKEFIINKQSLGKNTQDGIMLGSLYAGVSIIKNQTLRLREELSLSPTVIITGGDAPTLIPFLPSEYQYQPYLVLHGLALLIKNNN